MAVATEFKPTDTVVCCVAHISGDPPAASLEDEEMRGSDPRVARAPHFFVLKTAPKSERPNPLDHVIAINEQNARSLDEEKQRRFEAQAKANPVKIEAAPTVRAKKDIAGHLDGQPATVKKGSELPSDHPFVLEHEGDFS